ncbi:MAG: S1 family peptidase [Polyangiales bacterium]
MKRSFAALALLALPFTGCAVDASSPEVGQGQAPIINGVASTADDDAAVWVGILSSSGYPMGSCSGSFLADNVVLTARHCVSKLASEGVACTKDGKPISGGDITGDYKPTQLAIITGPKFPRNPTAAAKGQQVFTTGVNNLCNNDIALIVLDTHVPGAKIAQVRLNAPPKKAEKILAVGWGVSNNSTGYGRRRRADIPILAVGPASSAAGGIAPNEFEIGEGICSGDSGGPAFSMDTGAIVGVVSRGGNGAPYDPMTDSPSVPCTDTDSYKTHNIYTRVDGFKDLFDKAFAAAGTVPWVEGEPDPRLKKAGDACDSSAACLSGICIDSGGTKTCVDPCADGDVCPDGYSCTPVEDQKVCTPGAAPAANGADPATDAKGKSCAVSTPGAASSSLAGMIVLAGLVLAARRRRV